MADLKTIRMDSSRFIAHLNDSAQSKIAFYESKVAEMGTKASKNWKLAALRANNLYIEDVDSGQYFVANHRREKGGRFVIDNITPVEIVENRKSQVFYESCLSLVKAVHENNNKNIDAAFNRMAKDRFSTRVVPYSGKIRTRDGRTRHISIATAESIDSSAKKKLVTAIVESIKDKVVVKNGVVMEGHFSDGGNFSLKMNKWARYKNAARKMRDHAANAYLNEGFQDRIYDVAKLISKDKVEEAVKIMGPFLKENEEFTLLGRKGTQRLIENTLATKGVFNQRMCDDAATLVYRTNLKVNKDVIVKEWRGIGRSAQHPTLIENVNILESAKNFESATDKFLALIFETVGNREVTAEALATTLEVLRGRTPRIKESHDLSSKLNNLIDRLKGVEVDDNAIYEAEDFIATVQEELASGENLHDFDAMPGDHPMDDAEDMGEEVGDSIASSKPESTPSVVFNAPLISLNGEDFSKMLGGGSDPGADEELPDEDLSGLGAGMGEEQGGEQDDLLAAGAQAGGNGMNLESRGRRRKPISEEWNEDKYGPAPWSKKDKDDDDDDSEDEDCEGDECEPWSESADPYGYKPMGGKPDLSYGAPVLETTDVLSVANAMSALARKHGLSGRKLQANMEDLAYAGMSAVGVMVPEHKLHTAVEEVVRAFNENCGPPGSDPCDELGDENLDDREDSDPAEDQYKFGTTRRKGGLKRSSIGKTEKKVKSEGVTWHESQEDAVLGEMAGVKFIFDHGGSNDAMDPVILSEDGSVEIPIPSNLYGSAYAAARIGQGNPVPFLKWLREGIEQLRPESDEESAAIDSGMSDDGVGTEMELIDVDGDGDVDGVELDLGGDTDEMGGGLEEMGDDLEDMGMEGGLEDSDGLGGDGELEGAVVKITAGAGGVEVEIAPGTDVVEMGDDTGGMGPVDSGFEPEGDEPDGDEFGDDVGDDEPDGDEGSFDDFGGEDEGEESGEDDFDDEDGFAEDNDITSPQSSKYTKEVKGNLRDQPEVDLPANSDDEMEGFGKSPKEGSKDGIAKPAKSGSDD